MIKIILSHLDVVLLSKKTESYMKVEGTLTNVYPEWEPPHEKQKEDVKRNQIDYEHISTPCWDLEVKCDKKNKHKLHKLFHRGPLTNNWKLMSHFYY